MGVMGIWPSFLAFFYALQRQASKNVLSRMIGVMIILGPVFTFLDQAIADTIPALFPDPAPFLEAIEKEHSPREEKLPRAAGIIVPHHILAADLIARGFWAVAQAQYDRIIILCPDHFRKAKRPFAITTSDFQTPFGILQNDRYASASLASNQNLFEESSLFSGEHGIGAIIPFIKYFFPNAAIVPIAISYNSTLEQWDQAFRALTHFVMGKTLVIQSTDFSHYLNHPASLMRDQESLNVIGARAPNLVLGLLQSDHVDSKAAEYIQLKIQSEIIHASPVIIGNRNSAQYVSLFDSTTSYVVAIFSEDVEGLAKLRYADQEITYFGGDVFVGRWFTLRLANKKNTGRVLGRILSVTHRSPLIINLEGTILENPPEGVDPSLHFMDARLALPVLKELNVVAASVANNHSHDLGEESFTETIKLLEHSGIFPLEHFSLRKVGSLNVLAVNFIGKLDYKNYPVVRDNNDLKRLCAFDPQPPLIAFVHWGEEFTNQSQEAQDSAAKILTDCGASIIIGAHSHKASTEVKALSGGEQALIYSMGNLLFDQRGPKSTSALVELRRFRQGTVALRLIPLPNLFEFETQSVQAHDTP